MTKLRLTWHHLQINFFKHIEKKIKQFKNTLSKHVRGKSTSQMQYGVKEKISQETQYTLKDNKEILETTL